MADLQNKQVIVDRLKRRLGQYRANHNSLNSHFDSAATNLYSEQQKQTSLLRQRHIENKSKNKAKKSDKKQDHNLLLSNMGVSIFD